MSPFDQTSTMN